MHGFISKIIVKLFCCFNYHVICHSFSFSFLNTILLDDNLSMLNRIYDVGVAADCEYIQIKNITADARFYIKYNNILTLVNEYTLYIVYSVCFDFNGDANDCIFRTIPAGDSGRSRPPIPIDSGHRFRSNPAT